MSFNPANQIQDYLVFGEYGEVNPSINDSSTYTFLNPKTMADLFEHEIEGCFLYSRHWNPSNKYLATALAEMEATESAQVTASGMAAIANTLLQTCSAGDEIIASRTIYGGTYALLKNFLPRFGIQTKFVNIHDPEQLANALSDNTKVLYGESISNPLLEVAGEQLVLETLALASYDPAELRNPVTNLQSQALVIWDALDLALHGY